MQPSLFPSDVPAAFISEEDARRMLAPAEPLLWQSVMEPFEDFSNYRASDMNFVSMEHVDAAWWLSRQVKVRAKQLAEDFPEIGVVHKRARQQDFFTVNDEVAVVFKKITQRWSPRLGRMRYVRSNHKSQQNDRFWQQRAEEGFPDLPRFLVGYELVAEMTALRLFICYPRTKGLGFDWMYELDDYSQAVLRPTITVPMDDADDDRGFKVRPRKDAERREAQ